MKPLNIFKQKSYFDILIFSMVAFYPELYKYIWVVFSRLGIKPIANNLHTIIWVGIFIVFFDKFTERIKASDVFVYVGVVILMGIFCMFPWYYSFTPSRYLEFISGALPYFLLGRIFNYDDESKPLYRAVAALTLCLSAFYTYFYVVLDGELVEDNMHEAYLVLPAVLILVDSFMEKENVIFKVFGILGIIFLFLLGTRGPIVCTIAFVGLSLIKKFGSIKTGIVIALVVMLINAYLSSSYYASFLNSFTKTAEKMGFSTRVLTFIKEGDVMNVTGRSGMQHRVFEAIKNDPLEVRGPYSDWIIVGKKYDVTKQDVEEYGVYVHNFFLEAMCHYGVFWGGLFIIFMICSMLKLFIKCKKEKSLVPVMFICSGFIVLMFSSSYLIKDEFYFLLGLCFNNSFLTTEVKEDDGGRKWLRTM